MTDPQANRQPLQQAQPDWGRRLKWAGILLALALLAWLILNFEDLKARAELGTAYGAQIGCSCHYIAGRELESCEGDMEEAAWMVSLHAEDDNTIEASVPLLASAQARFDGAAGCRLLAR